MRCIKGNASMPPPQRSSCGLISGAACSTTRVPLEPCGLPAQAVHHGPRRHLRSGGFGALDPYVDDAVAGMGLHGHRQSGTVLPSPSSASTKADTLVGRTLTLSPRKASPTARESLNSTIAACASSSAKCSIRSPASTNVVSVADWAATSSVAPASPTTTTQPEPSAGRRVTSSIQEGSSGALRIRSNSACAPATSPQVTLTAALASGDVRSLKVASTMTPRVPREPQ